MLIIGVGYHPSFAIILDASHWEFGLWAFVRKDVTKKLRDKIAPNVGLLKVEDLESIAFSWTYWDKRQRHSKKTRQFGDDIRVGGSRKVPLASEA